MSPTLDDAWHAEADALAEGLQPGDFEAALAAELPDDLAAFATMAAADPDFEREYGEWLEHILTDDDHTLLLVIEQSCYDGMLLPWDMRGVRLATAPTGNIGQLHRMLDYCQRHVLVHLVHYVYWLVRIERARRRGSPEWSPSRAVSPEPDRMRRPPAFRPMRTWPSRWP